MPKTSFWFLVEEISALSEIDCDFSLSVYLESVLKRVRKFGVEPLKN